MTEILDYKNIYYINQSKRAAPDVKFFKNNGYDDERGDFRIIL